MKKIRLIIKRFFEQRERTHLQDAVKRLEDMFYLQEGAEGTIAILCNGITIQTFGADRASDVREVAHFLALYRHEAVKAKFPEYLNSQKDND